VYLLENGRTRAQLSVMRRICDALAVAPHEIDEFRIQLERTALPTTGSQLPHAA
jgi:hypothetical protein